jgi:hypothetical protein
MRIALAAVAVLACVAAGGVSGAVSPAPCGPGSLRGSPHDSEGAAGTISLALAFRNVSKSACTVRGYPALKLVGAPTRVQHGGLAFLMLPVRTVTIAPGRYASLLLAWSDVPTGTEKRCPTTHALDVTPGGRVRVTIGACNRGLLRESPFVGGLRAAP